MAGAEWVLVVYLGAAHTVSAPLSLLQPALGTEITLASVAYHGESLAPPPYYGYRVSYFPRTRSWIGVEAEFIHLKVYAETNRITQAVGVHRGERVDRGLPIQAVVERLSMSHGLNLILINAVARRTLRLGKDETRHVQLIGRVGAGPTVPHAESTIGGISQEGYTAGAPVLHAAGAVEIPLSRRFAALAEYKFTRSRQAVAVDRGEIRGLFGSHHGVFGIAWSIR